VNTQGTAGATGSKLVVAANRLPVRWVVDRWETSPGGLVRALTPILSERDGAWVGWAGGTDNRTGRFSHERIDQIPVPLSRDDIDLYYLGFCNGTLWPLYHDGIVTPVFHRHWWAAYERINQKYADHVSNAVAQDGVVWVQDYQLQLVPTMVRQSRPDTTIGFYLHTPFPPIEIFRRLPQRAEIVKGLLGADVVAFQTRSSASNFARCATQFGGAQREGRGLLGFNGRQVRLQRAPIGIDVSHFASLASSPGVQLAARQLRQDMGDPDQLILGVDRLDYTKGIKLRLKAIETLLSWSKDSDIRYEYVQVAVPSREAVPAYRELREDIEQVVGRINGDYARPGWSPIHYLYRNLSLHELVTYYVAADVMLVTPLRDGMNLVAKEYIASKVARQGTLILSEFAGAAEQLKSATLVNPFDVNEVAAAVQNSTAIDESLTKRRMRALYRTIQREDVYRWATRCLNALEA